MPSPSSREFCSHTSKMTSEGRRARKAAIAEISVVCLACLVALVAQDAVDQGPDVGLVIDD